MGGGPKRSSRIGTRKSPRENPESTAEDNDHGEQAMGGDSQAASNEVQENSKSLTMTTSNTGLPSETPRATLSSTEGGSTFKRKRRGTSKDEKKETNDPDAITSKRASPMRASKSTDIETVEISKSVRLSFDVSIADAPSKPVKPNVATSAKPFIHPGGSSQQNDGENDVQNKDKLLSRGENDSYKAKANETPKCTSRVNEQISADSASQPSVVNRAEDVQNSSYATMPKPQPVECTAVSGANLNKPPPTNDEPCKKESELGGETSLNHPPSLLSGAHKVEEKSKLQLAENPKPLDGRALNAASVSEADGSTRQNEQAVDAGPSSNNLPTNSPVAMDQDPSVESNSIFGFDGSIKTFAVGSEKNLELPDSVNASSKLRKFSSCTIGETSQKLSWLETEENNDGDGDDHKALTETKNPTTAAEKKALSPNEPIQQSCYRNEQSQSIEFQFPVPGNHKQSLSVTQLTMALFLESSRVDRGTGASSERAFANYWESLERFITLTSHLTSPNRSSFQIDETLNSFLTTKKLKRLHNKLILAILAEANRKEVSVRHFSRHLPDAWRQKAPKRILQPMSTQRELSDTELGSIDLDLQQWHRLLGKDSGAWSTYGKDNAMTASYNSVNVNINDSHKYRKSIADNDIIPSARIPASIHVDPLMRRYASDAGMGVSENAIWMMVVAVQEYMKSVLQKSMLNLEHNKSYASEFPKSSVAALVCAQHKPSKTSKIKISLPAKDSRESDSVSGNKGGVIRANELALLLESDPWIAGRSALSRMAWMRAASSGQHVGLEDSILKVNSVINSSILGANKVDASDKALENAEEVDHPSEGISLPSIALQPRKKQDTDEVVSPPPIAEKDTLMQGSSESSSAVHPPLITTATPELKVDDVRKYRPLAKAHLHVTYKPESLPTEENRCNPLDSTPLASSDKDLIVRSASTSARDTATTAYTPAVGVSLANAVLVSKDTDANENPTSTT